MFYFAYCTWLTEAEMHRFMPEGKIIAKGYVPNSLISFCTAGDDRERGWCHLDMTPDSWEQKTYGTVVEHDIEHYVDYPDFKRIPVTVYADDGKTYDCWTYVMENPGIAMKPPKAYWANVENGLKDMGFPEDYNSKVKNIYDKSAENSL